MNKDKGCGERIYKTVHKDKWNEERIYKTANEDKKQEERIHERGDKDGGNEERICNTMRKEEGIEWSDLVKKMATKNSQNICNKRKQQSEDMLEQRRKKKNKYCDNKKEKYSENEGEVNHHSEIDDICQNFPHFPTKPFTNFREEIAMWKDKHIEDKSYDEKLSQFVGRTLFYLFQWSQSQSTDEKHINGKDTKKGDLEKKIDLDDADIFDEVNNGSDNEDLPILKRLGKTHSLRDGKVFKANNNATLLNIDIPKNVQYLDIVETNNGELAFGYDYTNVFAN